MPKKQATKQKDPEKEALKNFRRANATHIAEFELEVTHQQTRALISTGKSVLWIKRRLQAYYRKRLEQLHRCKEYRALIFEYKHATAERKKEIGERLNAIQEELGITADAGEKLAAHYAKRAGILAVFGNTAADDVWRGVEEVLYKEGKHLHSSWSDNYFTFRSKQYNRAIVMKVENGSLTFSLRGVGTLHHKDISGDIFLVEEERAIIEWMQDPNADKKTVERFLRTGEGLSTYRPKFVILRIERVRGKWRVYAQVAVEGKAKEKKRCDGSPRFHRAVEGEIGVDIGTQSYAAVGASIFEMKNLAERNDKAIKDEARLRRLQRHLDRSQRAMNPQNYNENGTIKRGKKTWNKSKEYLRTQEKVRAYHRKCALNRKYAIQEDVNRLREHGSVIVSEKQSVKGWQKGLFGKSIQSRRPGLFRAELKRKFLGYVEVDIMYRASQYDHERDEYVKKRLSQRKHYHGDGRASPRDAYSGFLLWCHDGEYQSPDRGLCAKRFEDYYERVASFVEDCRERGVRVANGGF